MWTQEEMIQTAKEILGDFTYEENTRKFLPIGGIHELLEIWLNDHIPIFNDVQNDEIRTIIMDFSTLLESVSDGFVFHNEDDVLNSPQWHMIQLKARESLEKIDKIYKTKQ